MPLDSEGFPQKNWTTNCAGRSLEIVKQDSPQKFGLITG